jgi:hypothetical protein
MEQIINNYNETSTIINKVQKEIKMDKQKRNKQFETSLDELEAMC